MNNFESAASFDAGMTSYQMARHLLAEPFNRHRIILVMCKAMVGTRPGEYSTPAALLVKTLGTADEIASAEKIVDALLRAAILAFELKPDVIVERATPKGIVAVSAPTAAKRFRTRLAHCKSVGDRLSLLLAIANEYTICKCGCPGYETLGSQLIADRLYREARSGAEDAIAAVDWLERPLLSVLARCARQGTPVYSPDLEIGMECLSLIFENKK